jgi:hypothetical protein
MYEGVAELKLKLYIWKELVTGGITSYKNKHSTLMNNDNQG